MSMLSRKKQRTHISTKVTHGDKVTVIGFLFVLLGFPAIFVHIHSSNRQAAAVSKTVEEWKTIYHIEDAQAERIKQIEIDFHGSGSPFSFRPAHTKEEKERHHEEISSLMAPEDGARFIEAMKKKNGHH